MVPLKEGVLHITGLVYTLQPSQTSPSMPQKRTEASSVGGSLSLASHGDVGGIQGQRELSVRGPRLNRMIVERTSVMYGTDHRLSWTIRPPAPRLKVPTHHTGVGQEGRGLDTACDPTTCMWGVAYQRSRGTKAWRFPDVATKLPVRLPCMAGVQIYTIYVGTCLPLNCFHTASQERLLIDLIIVSTTETLIG